LATSERVGGGGSDSEDYLAFFLSAGMCISLALATFVFLVVRYRKLATVRTAQNDAQCLIANRYVYFYYTFTICTFTVTVPYFNVLKPSLNYCLVASLESRKSLPSREQWVDRVFGILYVTRQAYSQCVTSYR
jgi:hypothetical protein